MSKEYISPKGTDWKDFRKEFFTPEENAASDLRVAIIDELIKARDEKRISQKLSFSICWREMKGSF